MRPIDPKIDCVFKSIFGVQAEGTGTARTGSPEGITEKIRD